MLMPKGLTITIVFQAGSLNYGEGLGNISSLKKITRGNGDIYTYLSRQAICFNIKEQMGVNNTPIGLDKTVLQYDQKSTILDYPEIDLFGYMKTSKENIRKRNATVRVSNAISLEPFSSDIDFLTNKNLLERYNSFTDVKKSGGNISQSEKHISFYSYTITVDLEQVGIDINDVDKNGQVLEISNEEKANRIIKLLDTIKFLSRDIKGSREQLMPLFIIGGVYNMKNPFFTDAIKLDKNSNISIDTIKDILDLDEEIKEKTNIGLIRGYFKNEEDIQTELNATSVNNVFNNLKEEIKKYYLG